MEADNTVVDDIILRGTRAWFTQNPSVLAPIREELDELNQSDTRVRLWSMYFAGVNLHYQKRFKDADFVFEDLQIDPEIQPEKLLQALVARNRAVISNLHMKLDPIHDLTYALELAVEADDLHTQGTIHFNLGLTANRFDRDGTAVFEFTRALENFVECNDLLGQFASIMWRTFTREYSHVPERVSKEIAKLEDLATRIGSTEHKILALNRSGQFMLDNGAYRDALIQFQKVIDLQSELENPDPYAIAMGQYMIANTYYCMSENNAALEWAYRAMETVQVSELPLRDVGPTTIIANVLGDMGRLEESLAFFLRELAALEKLGSPLWQANVLTNIGITYNRAGDYAAAQEWLERASAILDELSDATLQGSLHDSLYNVYKGLRLIDKAYEQAERVIELLPEINAPRQRASLLATAIQHSIEKGDLPLAESYFNELQGMSLSSESLSYKAEKYKMQSLLLAARGDYDGAVAAVNQQVLIARQAMLRHVELDAQEQLLKLFRATEDVDAFFNQYELVNTLRDELKSVQQQRQMMLISVERQYEGERLQSAAREQLLNNVLPHGIAERLLKGETVIADDHDDVAVMFLDIVSFTSLAENVPPGHVIHLLNSIFQVCDEVMRKHDLTKVKTIGDAYLAVAGAPRRDNSENGKEQNTASAARAAMELKYRLDDLQITMPPELGDTSWVKLVDNMQVRIGLHIGSIVAGVVGTDRVAYDVWGDAVNIAARMEQTCEPGRIQVSDAFAKALPGAERPEFDTNDRVILKSDIATLVQRGNIPIKGKGDIKTWWLS